MKNIFLACKETFEVMDMFIILTVATVSQMYIHVWKLLKLYLLSMCILFIIVN